MLQRSSHISEEKQPPAVFTVLTDHVSDLGSVELNCKPLVSTAQVSAISQRRRLETKAVVVFISLFVVVWTLLMFVHLSPWKQSVSQLHLVWRRELRRFFFLFLSFFCMATRKTHSVG